VEATITIIVCSAIVVVALIIAVASYKSVVSEAVRAKERAEQRMYSEQDALKAKEQELHRLQTLFEKILEKAPAITVKKSD